VEGNKSERLLQALMLPYVEKGNEEGSKREEKPYNVTSLSTLILYYFYYYCQPCASTAC
jgi:hypothetical protein